MSLIVAAPVARSVRRWFPRRRGLRRARSAGRALAWAALAGLAAAAGCARGPARAVDEAAASVLGAWPIEAPAGPPVRMAAPTGPRVPHGGAGERAAALAPQEPGEGAAPAHQEPPGGAVSGTSSPASVPAGHATVSSGPAAAPDGFLDPITRSGERAAVTLEGCLRRALIHNLQVQIARFEPAIARTRLTEAEALFDPAWYLNNALGRIRQDAGTFLAGAATLAAKQWDFATGLETLLPTGATVALAQDWTYLDSNSAFFLPNPQYATGIGLEVRQPLLRGAGPEVTRSPIVLARLDHRISLAEFKTRLMDTLLEVERAYWDLVVAEARVRALTEALEAARENLRIARRRLAEGKAPRVVVSLARSAVTRRQADLVAARLLLVQASDRLKRLMNDPALPLEDPVVLKAAEVPPAQPITVDRVTYQASMLAAMRHRPEMDQAEAALEQADLRERVARNERLPQLDLAGRYRLTGLDADVGPAMREELGTNFFEWQVGLEFRVPLGNRARTAAYRRSRLEHAQAARRREDVRQAILLEVSRAVRNLAAAAQRILATRAAREAAEQTLRDQQANVAAGAALAKDLLDAQRDLADAKTAEVQAMADYMVALAELERAKGTLLEYDRIEVLDAEGAGDEAETEAAPPTGGGSGPAPAGGAFRPGGRAPAAPNGRPDARPGDRPPPRSP